MTDQRGLDRLLDAFFVEGTDEVADRVIDAVLDEVDHTQQRRAVHMPRRFPTMNMPTRLVAAAVIGVLAIGGAFYLTTPPRAAVGVAGPTADGSRQLVIMVNNMTKAPVDLFVAEDGSPMGQEVGTAVPSTIPTMSGREVVFTVPSGERWAIYVNPGPDGGGLISARDVPPTASGALPFTIWVDEGVEPIVVGPGGERLFGG